METSSPHPAGRAAPQPPEPGGPGSEMAAIPRDAEHDDDVDALYLAGQLPSDEGEWLLVTELDGLPGAAFTVRHLPRGGGPRVGRPSARDRARCPGFA